MASGDYRRFGLYSNEDQLSPTLVRAIEDLERRFAGDLEKLRSEYLQIVQVLQEEIQVLRSRIELPLFSLE